jgi:hypothetical protein
VDIPVKAAVTLRCKQLGKDGDFLLGYLAGVVYFGV